MKEADVGVPVKEIWRKHGISSATYYKWRAKYGGLAAQAPEGVQRRADGEKKFEYSDLGAHTARARGATWGRRRVLSTSCRAE